MALLKMSPELREYVRTHKVQVALRLLWQLPHLIGVFLKAFINGMRGKE